MSVTRWGEALAFPTPPTPRGGPRATDPEFVIWNADA